MSSHRFLTPVFRGGRFESQALPVEVLSDLVAYRDLLVDLAGHLLMSREPTRKRLPKGFADSVRLVVRGVKPGSAIVEIDRESTGTGTTPSLFPDADVYAEARDLVERCLACARRREPLPSEFPAHFTKRFNQFGRSLRDGESVELRSADNPSGPIYDQDVRRWIVLQHDTSYEDVLDQVMMVDGAEYTNERVVLRTNDSRAARYDAPAPPETVSQALKIAPTAVRVVGVGQFSGNGELLKVLHVETILSPEDDPVTRTSLTDRFATISSLDAGWFDGTGEPFDRALLSEVERFVISGVEQFALPLPYVYPAPDGEVRIEWPLPGWDVTVRAELSTRTLAVLAVGPGDDDVEEFDVPWTDPAAAERIAALVNSHTVRG